MEFKGTYVVGSLGLIALYPKCDITNRFITKIHDITF